MFVSKTFTLKEIATLLSLEYSGNESVTVSGVGNLVEANNNEVTFLSNDRYTSFLKKSNAGIICVDRKTKRQPDKNYLISDDPSLTFEAICDLLLQDHFKSGFSNIHPTACIHESAIIGSNAEIGPYVVIDRDVVVGNKVVIRPHVYIGPKCTIGDDCIIHSNVSIREDSHLGNRVILQPGCVIGNCGFGYSSNKKTGVHTKTKQLGSTILEDDVEIGSNSCVDRSRFEKTVVKKGTKVANLSIIGHNCQIGEHNLILSQSGLAGSVKTGNHVIIAAQCGVVGHTEIASGVKLIARSATSKSLTTPNGYYGGTPAQPLLKAVAELVAIKKLPEVLKKLKKAEKFLESLESS